jgi:hypothetical protein
VVAEHVPSSKILKLELFKSSLDLSGLEWQIAHFLKKYFKTRPLRWFKFLQISGKCLECTSRQDNLNRVSLASIGAIFGSSLIICRMKFPKKGISEGVQEGRKKSRG